MNAKRPHCAAPALESTAPVASQSYHYCNLEHTEVASTALAEEVALAIAYNDISQAVMLVTPTDLEDFIVGFSLGSGIITDVNDIYDLMYVKQLDGDLNVNLFTHSALTAMRCAWRATALQ